MNPAHEHPSADGLWTGLRLAAAPDAQAAIVVAQGAIRWVGARSALPAEFAGLAPHDGGGALVTPGLVDCHTHLVYGGQRANEFAMRLAGATYEEVAKAGGGIVSSVRATREADEDTLFAQAAARLEQLLADGVCAIEIKSGYGLSLEHERKQLRVARRLGEAYGVTVRTTFLGAHALPPEYAGQPNGSADYIDLVCNQMLPALAAEGLVDAVDVFCERIAFSLAETEQVFQAAKALGLPVKLHAEQLSDMGGAALAARYGALSCDHIEHLSAEGIAAMRRSGTVAVLLPGAYYTLRDTHLPPVDALRAAGVPMAVSTDHNPGTSPALSLLLMVNMACTLFRLTVPEALDGVTVHAARALGLQATHGAIAPGMPANFVLWNVREAAELAYWFGQRPVRTVVRQGRIAVGAAA
ncbi:MULTISPECIES: imidazolonepropionase [unclassified Variovorax]|uniref:imidazolonepropionase n=1 Tax=unclassified Variovorax TaxID=663243 RepID=UPI0008BDF519|nr:MULTISPECIES: imidazolonepropionase [unclassified Variovorax]SEJ85294.1 imidazolonepropionase [Variovorax sp. OK202]SFD00437.1 imidazolonepropionase [Variovorax sp. OK212]